MYIKPILKSNERCLQMKKPRGIIQPLSKNHLNLQVLHLSTLRIKRKPVNISSHIHR